MDTTKLRQRCLHYTRQYFYAEPNIDDSGQWTPVIDVFVETILFKQANPNSTEDETEAKVRELTQAKNLHPGLVDYAVASTALMDFQRYNDSNN